MSDHQIERQSVAYHSWRHARMDFYPHTLLHFIGQRRRSAH